MKKNLIWAAVLVVIGVVGLGNIVVSNLEVSREEKRIEEQGQQKVEEEKKEMEQSQPKESSGEGKMHWISKDNLQSGITIVSSYVKEGNNIRTTHTVTNNYHLKGVFTSIDISHSINNGEYSKLIKGIPISIKSGENKTFEVLLENVDVENIVDYQASIVRILEILD